MKKLYQLTYDGTDNDNVMVMDSYSYTKTFQALGITTDMSVTTLWSVVEIPESGSPYHCGFFSTTNSASLTEENEKWLLIGKVNGRGLYERDTIAELVKFCQAAGIRYIKADPDPENFGSLVRLCQRLGFKHESPFVISFEIAPPTETVKGVSHHGEENGNGTGNGLENGTGNGLETGIGTETGIENGNEVQTSNGEPAEKAVVRDNHGGENPDQRG